MPQTITQQRVTYPLAAYNFRVTIDGFGMRFAKVAGLQREHQTVTYRHGLSFLEGESIQKFFVDKFVPITLEQGTVAGHKFLYDWLERKTASVMEVSLCDANGAPTVMWRVAKTLPVKLTAPTYDASVSQASIDLLEVRGAGISIKHL